MATSQQKPSAIHLRRQSTITCSSSIALTFVMEDVSIMASRASLLSASLQYACHSFCPISEQPLWNDQNIAWLYVDILCDVSIAHERIDFDPVGLLLTAGGLTDQHGSIAIGVAGQPTNVDHHVQQGHARTVRKRA